MRVTRPKAAQKRENRLSDTQEMNRPSADAKEQDNACQSECRAPLVYGEGHHGPRPELQTNDKHAGCIPFQQEAPGHCRREVSCRWQRAGAEGRSIELKTGALLPTPPPGSLPAGG